MSKGAEVEPRYFQRFYVRVSSDRSFTTGELVDAILKIPVPEPRTVSVLQESEVEQVEYLSGRFSKRWLTGELVRVWKNGSASIRTPGTGDGWLIVRAGQWRRKK